MKTDLELCKKIAEIEGVDVVEDGGGLRTYIKVGATCVKTLCENYNPLTNKALLFDLMVKYNVCIDRGFAGIEQGLAEIWPKDIDTCSLIGTYCAEFKSNEGIPRAILECIVKANDL